jgi:periplasmic divalent cation tolerance protein
MSPQPGEALVCLITAPRDAARPIASALVETGLAACVNVAPLVHSIYRWEGRVHHDEEALLVVKSTRSAFARIEGLLDEIHPYDTFELVALDIAAGSQPYLAWIGASVAAPGGDASDA